MQEDVASWGHEYIRSLSGEIGEEYHARREKDESVEDLLGLVGSDSAISHDTQCWQASP